MRVIFILLISVFSNQALSVEPSFTLENSIFEKVALEEGVDPLLLYSIALTESAMSAGKGNIKPYPYVFRSNATGAKYFDSRMDAERELRKLLAVTNNVDIGMMQINLHYHPQKNPLLLLDPTKNLEVAVGYLKKTLASTEDPILGVGRYHSWTKELAYWYGQRVWKTYNNIAQLIAFE